VLARANPALHRTLRAGELFVPLLLPLRRGVMPTARVLNGVLRGLLNGYTSRNSDHDGYWVFGQLVPELESDSFDLMCPASGELTDPRRTAHEIAVARFTHQLEKAEFPPDRLSSARLDLERQPNEVTGSVNGRPRAGYVLRFRATAITNTGRPFSYEIREFVAPHDPQVEHRSIRRIGDLSPAGESVAEPDNAP
jgi:hypothetical protein